MREEERKRGQEEERKRGREKESKREREEEREEEREDEREEERESEDGAAGGTHFMVWSSEAEANFRSDGEKDRPLTGSR